MGTGLSGEWPPRPHRVTAALPTGGQRTGTSGETRHMSSERYDLVVAGATPAGICAAIAAARYGLRVGLVDPLPEPGQMLSNGLCVLDSATPEGISGIMREFVARVAAYHRTHYSDLACFRENRGAPRHGFADGLGFEPKVAAHILREMIADTAGLTYWNRHQFTGVVMEGRRCAGFRACPIDGKGFNPLWAFREHTAAMREGETQFLGAAVIDATYEGDIAAWAGVPFRVGREARSIHEPHNGIIMSDYLSGRAALNDGWLPETFLPGSTGEADPKVMAYNVRYVVKHYGRKDGPHRLQKPDAYDPTQFRPNGLGCTGPLPDEKRFVNAPNRSNDMQGDLVATYPDGSPTQRRKVLEALYERARQHLYFLQNEMDQGEWGLADDEFPENGGWPYCVYVREARRIVGLRYLTESDVHRWLPRVGDSLFDGIPGDRSRPPLQHDSIAVGDYDLDCRGCAQEPASDYAASGEGAFLYSSSRAPFQVPYGCMVPVDVEGLLVACAVSVSHVAMCVVRMEPVWAQLGEAAGIAAAIAHRSKCAFRDINPAEIQAERIRSGCQLYYYRDVPPDHPAFSSIQWLSLRACARGYTDWSFRPDRLITSAEWVQMLVAVFDLWPSVTGNHFDDVPPSHPAFIAYETLYDHGARAGKRLVAFERFQRVYCDENLGYRVFVRPDADLPSDTAVRMLALMTGLDDRRIRALAGFEPGQAGLTRGEAARLLEAMLRHDLAPSPHAITVTEPMQAQSREET